MVDCHLGDQGFISSDSSASRLLCQEEHLATVVAVVHLAGRHHLSAFVFMSVAVFFV